MATPNDYMQIARGILDDYGLIETLEEAHGLDQEEAEHDRDMIAREIRDALAEARHDGAAVAFGLIGMAEAINLVDRQRKNPIGCRVCPPSSICPHCRAVWWSCLCEDETNG